MKKSNHTIERARSTTVIENVKKNMLNAYLFMNKMLIVAFVKLGKTNRSIIGDMLLLIKKESPTSKLGGTLCKETPKARILLKNGNDLKRSMIISVLIARKKKILQKTTLSLSLLVEATISQTFSLYVGVAIVGNGRSFNIYENPELL